MDIKIEERAGVVVLVLGGRFDAGAVDGFKAAVYDCVAKGQLRLVADLGDIRFLDSSGLGALVAVLRSIAAHKGELKLAAPGPEVRALFELTRLDRVFAIHRDRAEAVDSYS